ncbi:trypsin-like peptidase domain-containing protein [Corynebacterium sp. TAE3-ERU12]|uniref:S1C family serine protease n=1 Tax=Corynebacterium sp. TAE3-ERU12 TaxID=2849491 RepID=UPI001C443D25|nr:trypsin-like peptidase domain-containing protein [Corynebacterium sp. TAE3-ERU12]MBV7295595.1 trypsin-like peptidase domain-containing protein [Corynebacterium sp. TAE3-ERU12]
MTNSHVHARGLSSAAVAGLVLVAGTIGGVTGGVVVDNISDDQAVTAPATTSSPIPEAPKGNIESIAEKVLPSVVSINVRTPNGGDTGSGSILSSDGLVLTNHHVVAKAREPQATMEVVLNDGKSYPARLVASHPQSDIAVIKIDNAQDLRPIELGDSDAVRVGQEVVAVGSPLGLTATVTSGIVSALDRPVSASGPGGESSVIDAIQTDAPINPGNSGGALVDANGRLIGVPSVIASTSQQGAGSIGLGFAIPVNQARQIASQLIDQGSVEMPVINALIDVRSSGGAEIAEVTPGGPADRAGLRPGDIIVGFEDRRVDSGVGLIAAIRSRKVGDTVTLKVQEGTGETRDVRVTLEAAPE